MATSSVSALRTRGLRVVQVADQARAADRAKGFHLEQLAGRDAVTRLERHSRAWLGEEQPQHRAGCEPDCQPRSVAPRSAGEGECAVFTMADFSVHDPDPCVHDPETAVHDPGTVPCSG
jgi:hypothetical protein